MIMLLRIIMDIKIMSIYMSALHLKRTKLFINLKLENLEIRLELAE